MPVLLSFESLDDSQRAKLILDTPRAAARHVVNVLNRGKRRGRDLWTYDEEGVEAPAIRSLIEQLDRGDIVRLYDQDGWHSDDQVTIEKVGFAT